MVDKTVINNSSALNSILEPIHPRCRRDLRLRLDLWRKNYLGWIFDVIGSPCRLCGGS
jgi:hypothetical protein